MHTHGVVMSFDFYQRHRKYARLEFAIALAKFDQHCVLVTAIDFQDSSLFYYGQTLLETFAILAY